MLIRNFSIILYDSNQQFDNTFWIEAPRPDGKEKQGSLLHGDMKFVATESRHTLERERG